MNGLEKDWEATFKKYAKKRRPGLPRAAVPGARRSASVPDRYRRCVDRAFARALSRHILQADP